ncbi:SdpI family protein [Robiginitalea marina]|uniref:SdpI family protein n=1 Tax=Robiginitalea marina TaxID=2954105 RepID=A0ABT1AZA5_9FLAO|nr:SdpI family protein [Robiginitalea marina]MCO5725312.1 SdpI family protein [Robiginitalea marina]
MEALLTNPWTLTLVLTGVIFAISGTILWKYPPKNINWLYGYRTARSMKSQECWDFAQTYAARGMVWVGGIQLVLGLAGLQFPMHPGWAAFLAIVVMCLMIGVLLFRVEHALKARFGT